MARLHENRPWGPICYLPPIHIGSRSMPALVKALGGFLLFHSPHLPPASQMHCLVQYCPARLLWQHKDAPAIAKTPPPPGWGEGLVPSYSQHQGLVACSACPTYAATWHSLLWRSLQVLCGFCVWVGPELMLLWPLLDKCVLYASL